MLEETNYLGLIFLHVPSAEEAGFESADFRAHGARNHFLHDRTTIRGVALVVAAAHSAINCRGRFAPLRARPRRGLPGYDRPDFAGPTYGQECRRHHLRIREHQHPQRLGPDPEQVLNRHGRCYVHYFECPSWGREMLLVSI
jgi:hypothetical protein